MADLSKLKAYVSFSCYTVPLTVGREFLERLWVLCYCAEAEIYSGQGGGVGGGMVRDGGGGEEMLKAGSRDWQIFWEVVEMVNLVEY